MFPLGGNDPRGSTPLDGEIRRKPRSDYST